MGNAPVLKAQNKLKILNDPIYGFISVPSEEVFQIIEHPYFQRLRRVTQMGLSYLVYPGAHHTRFHHALGCLSLMIKAVQTLRNKGVKISDQEEDGLYKAILLHDIGHGPYSHALEHQIVTGATHEDLSLCFMENLNAEFNGSLTLAIQIFKGEYHRPFMLDLVSSQLDIDRLDYLKRDSFYTGVVEGDINSQRLISMLNVVDDRLVVEEKGIYSVENFLSGRRLMYWQVYLHKTGIGAEHLLQSVLQRIKELDEKGVNVPATDNLHFFLTHDDLDFKDPNIIHRFALLDDSDVIMTLKQCLNHDDFVLRELCRMLLHRELLKIKFTKKPIAQEKIQKRIDKLKDQYHITDQEAAYFVFSGVVSNIAYSDLEPINILTKNNKVVEFTRVGNEKSFKALNLKTVKYYCCYPKPKEINE